MTEWLDYEVSDFILFSADVYWRLFALENCDLFPWSVVAPIAGASAMILRYRCPQFAVKALCLFLASSWTVACVSFLWNRYGAINWAAPYATPIYVAAALALLAVRLRRIKRTRWIDCLAGQGLMVYGLALYPVAAPVFGRDLMTAEVVGVAPDPTAVATLGLSFFLLPGWLRFTARLAAAVWLLVSVATLLALGQGAFWAPATALFIWVAGILHERIKSANA